MKNLSKLFLFMAICGLLVSCTKSEHYWGDDPLGNVDKGSSSESVLVTVPLKCNFTVWDHSDYTDRRCGDPPNFFLTMEGEGVVSHLGKMTTFMTFCCNGATGAYGNTVGWLEAANGDVLNFEIPDGQIYPNTGENSDYYQSWFNDQMIFTGGTGRFAGASGEGMTNAYVHDPTDEDPIWHTDFFSTGTLILVKK